MATRMTELMKSSAEWINDPQYVGVTVLDPDGWDRSNFEQSWAEPITKAEFCKRLLMSTVVRKRQ